MPLCERTTTYNYIDTTVTDKGKDREGENQQCTENIYLKVIDGEKFQSNKSY